MAMPSCGQVARRLSGCFALAALLALGSAGLVWAQSDGVAAQPVPVESVELLELDGFRDRVAAARRADAAWVHEPLQMALRFVGPFEGRSQQITRRYDTGDGPSAAEIIVVEDGYLDDSVRGAWYRLVLERQEDGSWALARAERAWRCWPGRGHEGFSAARCL